MQKNNGRRDLLKAIRLQQIGRIKTLLEDDKVNPNSAGITVTTPLHEAVKTDNLFIVKMLVAAGADVDRKTKDSLTAMDIARKKGSVRVMRYLESEKLYKTLKEYGSRGKRKIRSKKQSIKESFRRARKKAPPKNEPAKDGMPLLTAATLPEVFEAGKWVGNINEMQKLWEEVPARLKAKFDFSAVLNEARLETLKKNAPPKKPLRKKPPDPV